MRNLVWTLPSPTSRRYATHSDTSPSLLTNFTSSSPPMAALLTYSQTNPRLRFFSPSGPSLRCPSRPLIFCTNSSRLNDVSTVLKLHSSDGKRRAALMKAGALSATVSEPEPNKSGAFSNCRTILLSGVVVKSPRRTFGGGRRWNSLDVATAGVVLSMHVLSLFAPFCFNWSALCVALSLYFITGLFGITLSFHRNLSHRSFKLPKWLEYSFAYCGSLALQGSPIDWVSTHRYHHQFTDSERDPHSPIEGFWFSHISWLFDETAFKEKCGEPNNVMDLQKQSFYRFLQCTYIAHPIALGVLLFALGGLPFLVWGMGVRTVWVFHITWLVNSACHVWGKQAWNTRDLSRNNWWVALLAFGEGWHNNHHAFEFSARHGLEWWQLDMTWYVVRFLQAIGLATDVKLPTEIQKQKLSLKVES